MSTRKMGRPRPTLRPSSRSPLCPRLPWWPDPDTRDPACCHVRVPGHEYRPLQPVGQDKTPVEAHGQVLPLLGRAAGPQTDLVPPADLRGRPGPRPPPPPPGRVRREIPPAAADRETSMQVQAPGVYIGMQEGAAQMHVRTVGIVGQMAADGLADLASTRPCCTTSFGPCTQLCLVPKAAGVRQYPGHVWAYGGGQVALLAEAFGSAQVVHERLPVEDPREILCVVDTIEAVALGQQQAFEGWQGGLQLVHRDFGHIHLCHEEIGRFCLRVQLSPLHLFVGVELDPGDCRSDFTAFGSVWTMFVCMWPRVVPSRAVPILARMGVDIRATMFFAELSSPVVQERRALVRILQEKVADMAFSDHRPMDWNVACTAI